MKDSKLIDSSVWLDYFINGLHKKIIDSNEILMLSALSLFEIKKKLTKIKVSSKTISKSIGFIKKRSIILSLNAEIAEKAVDVSIEKNLPAIIHMLILRGKVYFFCQQINLKTNFLILIYSFFSGGL